MEAECEFCGYKFEPKIPPKSKTNIVYCPRCSSIVYVKTEKFGPFAFLERLPTLIKYLFLLILLGALVYLVLNMLGYVSF